MKLEIENKHLIRVVNFLDELSLKGMKSIHRTNLSSQLQEKLKVVGENERQLREELKGNKEELREELDKFMDEKVVIDDGDSQTMLNSVKSVVKELTEEGSEYEFKGDNAYAVACLYEAFKLGGEQ